MVTLWFILLFIYLIKANFKDNTSGPKFLNRESQKMGNSSVEVVDGSQVCRVA